LDLFISLKKIECFCYSLETVEADKSKISIGEIEK